MQKFLIFKFSSLAKNVANPLVKDTSKDPVIELAMPNTTKQNTDDENNMKSLVISVLRSRFHCLNFFILTYISQRRSPVRLDPVPMQN